MWEVLLIPTQTFFNLDSEKKNRIIEAAMEEFSNHNFEHAKLSHIVKAAGIPRGSMYQYFEDKEDLYFHIFELVKQRKMEYMTDLLPNPDEKPFIVLFRELFTAGMRFSIENPRYVKMFTRLMDSKGEIYDKLMRESMQYAIQFYINYIKEDQKKGLIRDDIDPEVFAKIVANLTINVSFDEINISGGNVDYEKMNQRIQQILTIIEHGVTKGDPDVQSR